VRVRLACLFVARRRRSSVGEPPLLSSRALDRTTWKAGCPLEIIILSSLCTSHCAESSLREDLRDMSRLLAFLSLLGGLDAWQVAAPGRHRAKTGVKARIKTGLAESSSNVELDSTLAPRRKFLVEAFVSSMSITQLVGAKELPTVEVHEGFSLVRKEVESGGVVELGQMVENEEWERILEFTKLYDLSFRKLTLKQVANALTDKASQDKANEIRSKITFDLIAVNKASRPQFRAIAKPSAEEAMRVLRGDLGEFLALEPPL